MTQPSAADRSTLAVSAGLTGLVLRVEQFIAAGGRAVAVVGPPGVGKMRLAEAVLSGLPGRQTRVANPELGPLSMKRVLRQLGLPSDSGADGPFFGMLAEQASSDHSAALVVQDAHTLTPYALSVLCRVPGLGGPQHPGMLLFLIGEPPLLGKLSAPGLDLLRNPRRTMVLTLPKDGAGAAAGAARLMWTPMAVEDRLDSSQAGTAAEIVRARLAAMPIRRPMDSAAPSPPPRPATPRQGGLMLAGAMGVAIVLGWMAWPQPTPPLPETAVAVAEQDAAAPGGPPKLAIEAAPVELLPEPVEPKQPAPPNLAEPAVGPAPAVMTAPPPDLAAPAPEPTPAQIKREFDAFLNRAGRDTAKLTVAAREALFREYLQWRIRASLAGP